MFHKFPTVHGNAGSNKKCYCNGYEKKHADHTKSLHERFSFGEFSDVAHNDRRDRAQDAQEYAKCNQKGMAGRCFQVFFYFSKRYHAPCFKGLAVV